jgi:hypothetical protein
VHILRLSRHDPPPITGGDSVSPDSDPTISFEIAVKKAEGVERFLGVTVSVETVKAAEDKAARRRQPRRQASRLKCST